MQHCQNGGRAGTTRKQQFTPSPAPERPFPSANQYPYKPLDPGRNEIRLLRLCEPFEVNDPISCTISHVSLDLNPKYEALSYTWCDRAGDAQLNKKVLLGGHIVSVTWNLEAALRKLLRGDEERVFWIDALCINQTDVAERNEQVSKMKLVYQRAQGVASWLGDEYDDSRGAFELLRAFRQLGVQKSLYDGPEPWTLAMTLPSSSVQKTHAIIKLFRREYWRRAWVV
jgi:hypothetical protein